MTHLFDPLTLRGITMRNRIGVAPMCQYSAEDGFANDWHLVHLGAMAAGGVGLIIAEATAVEARGRISPADAGIWKDEHIESWARVTRFIKGQGAVAGIQIAHAGRKAGTKPPWLGGQPATDEDGGWQPVAPSAIPFMEKYRTPTELSLDEIKVVQQAFVDAAIRSVEAGFDFIEIHGAHGYLTHSFYSPLTNKRTDAYGGSFENRTRFVMEVAERIREAIPDEKILAVRLSTTDWHESGWTGKDSVRLSTGLKSVGVDIIDCSSGGAVPNLKIPAGASYQVPLAEQVRREAGIPTAAVGLITEPMQADEVVRNGRADVVLLGREMLRNPHWAIDAARALKHDAPIPNQYLRGY